MTTQFDDPRHPFEISHHLCSYPFPLSTGEIATILLPEKITLEDAVRLGAFVHTLVIEDE